MEGWEEVKEIALYTLGGKGSHLCNITHLPWKVHRGCGGREDSSTLAVSLHQLMDNTTQLFFPRFVCKNCQCDYSFLIYTMYHFPSPSPLLLNSLFGTLFCVLVMWPAYGQTDQQSYLCMCPVFPLS